MALVAHVQATVPPPAGAGLRVRVLVEDHPDGLLHSHARTVLRRRTGSLVFADVYLKSSRDAAAFIAHEFEHILEQLDGVDLAAQIGNGAVWKDRGAFETQRAIDAGRRAAREIMTGAEAADDRDTPLEDQPHRLATVPQQDRDAGASSVRSARVSGSGRHIVFTSWAQLAEADRNRHGDVYVLELASGHYSLESIASGGLPGNGESMSPDISDDGRYVVFASAAGNLADRQSLPGTFRVFLRDRHQGMTRLLATNENGGPANGTSANPVISADGTAVVLESRATDLIAGDEIGRSSGGLYLIHLTSGRRSRVDLSSASETRAGQSMSPTISADGRFVAFASKADLTCWEAPACVTEPSDKNGIVDIYLRDTQTNITTRISRGYGGGDADGPSYDPAISGDGRHLAFVSEASNLTRDSRNRVADIYVHDLVTGITDVVSVTPSGQSANGASLRPALSHDGAKIAFQSLACNFVCKGYCQGGQRDVNLLWDIFVHDRSTRRTTRLSTDSGEEWMESSRAPSLDASGRMVAFASRHPINEGDAAHDEDLYVYRFGESRQSAAPSPTIVQRRHDVGYLLQSNLSPSLDRSRVRADDTARLTITARKLPPKQICIVG